MGQSSGFLQLHFIVATTFLFNTDLLWPSMLCFSNVGHAAVANFYCVAVEDLV